MLNFLATLVVSAWRRLGTQLLSDRAELQRRITSRAAIKD